MTYIIVMIGLFLILAGVSLLLKPQFIFGILNNNLENISLFISAILARLTLGILLISSAGISKYPTALAVIGWIAIIAAIVFLAIGPTRFRRLMSWVISVFTPYGRAGGIGSAIFGMFLIYAYL